VTGAVPIGMTAADFESIVKPRKGPFARSSTKGWVPPAPPPARPDV
jgi:hypothetical protein